MSDKTVYLVHCVDTEGPLYESIEATFERLEKAFGLVREATEENLLKLRNGEDKDVPDNIRSLVMDIVSEDRLNYNSTWEQVDAMLNVVLSEDWRNQYVDDYGQGYTFSWFVIDHVGFDINPRHRAVGYHTVFDHYDNKLKEWGCDRDEVHWHFHPVSYFKEGNKSSNSYSYTNEHLQVFSRRVIDRLWFPSAFRPGLHTERPDINLFLEQWIPFDYGNQGMDESRNINTNLQKDLAHGRYGDWRRATGEWEVYHPDFYDYQKKGAMKRYIARCLNLNSRLRALDDYEIEKAFQRADNGQDTIMAYTNHDHREIRGDISGLYASVKAIQKKYPEVKIKNSTAVEAIRETLSLSGENPLQFEVNVDGNVFSVKTDKSPWGCQPYFCFKTKSGEYIHENLDSHGQNLWSFTFDEDTIELSRLDSIGLAANDAYGNTTVMTIDPQNQIIKTNGVQGGQLTQNKTKGEFVQTIT